MAIPIIMLRKVHLSPRKKAGLAVIFCLTVKTTVFAIVRVEVIDGGTNEADPTRLSLWTSIEANIGKSCLCNA